MTHPERGAYQTQLRHFYLTVIRPVLEYAAPVWHHLITKTQADQIEAIQRRAIRIIYTCTHDMPYVSATFVADLPTMSDRGDQLSRKFFNSTLQPTSPLHRLLPPPRDQPPVTSLQAASKCPRIPTRTKKVSVLSLVCPSPLSDLTRSSPNHYDCILLIIVLYYCVLFFYYCILFSPLFSLMATIF